MDTQTLLPVLLTNGRGFYGIGHNKYNIDMKTSITNPKTVHAEVDASMKLRITKKQKKVYLLVLRTNRRGDCLMMAKPCDNCIKKSTKLINDKGYKLKDILYSNECGEIVKL